MPIPEEFKICVLNESSDINKYYPVQGPYTLTNARQVLGDVAKDSLFLHISTCKPIHPSDEAKYTINDVSHSGTIILQRKRECPWPTCSTCLEVLKEYPGTIGVSVAEIDFSFSRLVS